MQNKTWSNARPEAWAAGVVPGSCPIADRSNRPDTGPHWRRLRGTAGTVPPPKTWGGGTQVLISSTIFRKYHYKLHCICKLRFRFNRQIRVPRLLDCDSPCFLQRQFTIRQTSVGGLAKPFIATDVQQMCRSSGQLYLGKKFVWLHDWQWSYSRQACLIKVAVYMPLLPVSLSTSRIPLADSWNENM